MTSRMTAEAFQVATGVDAATLKRLTLYVALLEKWQTRINLVGRSTLEDPWRRHFFDSAQVLGQVPEDTETLIDLGSGAGFPALVLAILLQGRCRVHLIESDQRKCAFLREANRVTDAGAVIHNRRIEAVDDLSADVITARALASLDQLLGYAVPLLRPGGRCLFLKGRTHREELTEARKRWKMRHHLTPSQTDPDGVIIMVEDPSLATA